MSIFNKLVDERIKQARSKYPKIVSFHEGYGIFEEEREEFFDEVKRKNQIKLAILDEIIDMVAVLKRTAIDMELVDD